MEILQTTIEIPTRGQGLVDITREVNAVVAKSGIEVGLCTVFVQHTSASLVIQENADPSVRADLEEWFSQLAPEARDWRHDEEGPDDMPAHARSSITRTSEVIPISRARLALGTWQGLYLWEHRRLAHRRRLVVHVQGQSSTSPSVSKTNRRTEAEEDEPPAAKASTASSEEEQRLAALGQYVAGIGHELRNPLNTIETSAYVLAQRLIGAGSAATVDPAILKHLDKIRNQVQVASKVVASVLSLAKNRPPSRVWLELGPLVERAVRDLSPGADVRVATTFDQHLSVLADADQLRMVLTNLLSNAIEAIEGEGTISITAETTSEGISIWVADDGPGISAPQRERIFDALFTTKAKGHGLGLALSRRIAQAHGGQLQLEESERGARFHLWLPATERRPEGHD